MVKKATALINPGDGKLTHANLIYSYVNYTILFLSSRVNLERSGCSMSLSEKKERSTVHKPPSTAIILLRAMSTCRPMQGVFRDFCLF